MKNWKKLSLLISSVLGAHALYANQTAKPGTNTHKQDGAVSKQSTTIHKKLSLNTKKAKLSTSRL
ncbi:hypothetical protein [Facilibium subflavum]|uniref:hypothetical protein n=1 Tax=Facilibium subflavum TaxID=2219058 RepID=UPI000E657890|nr:hypothetical protein [Facilibium subflavum]